MSVQVQLLRPVFLYFYKGYRSINMVVYLFFVLCPAFSHLGVASHIFNAFIMAYFIKFLARVHIIKIFAPSVSSYR